MVIGDAYSAYRLTVRTASVDSRPQNSRDLSCVHIAVLFSILILVRFYIVGTVLVDLV